MLVAGSPNLATVQNQWLESLLYAVSFIAWAFLGCWLSDTLIDDLGL